MTLESPPTMALRLTADPARLAAVRQAVRDQLLAWARPDLADAATLCVTELLANVHRHAGSPDCELTLDRLPEGVRAGVSDRSHVVPVVPPCTEWSAENGRGLLLITAASYRWGTTLTSGGKQVWVELR